jgi:hypothetical protein
LQHGIGSLVLRKCSGVEMDFGRFRRLVGRVDAGEVLDFAAPGLLV